MLGREAFRVASMAGFVGLGYFICLVASDLRGPCLELLVVVCALRGCRGLRRCRGEGALVFADVNAQADNND